MNDDLSGVSAAVDRLETSLADLVETMALLSEVRAAVFALLLTPPPTPPGKSAPARDHLRSAA